jgi:nicotinate-nucleotide pyrophosphorylase (carboxylating)
MTSSADTARRLAAREAAQRALAEDLAGLGDLAGRVFTGSGRADVVAREEGVLSGTLPFLAAAELVDPALEVEFGVRDGERFAASQRLGTVAGPFASILALERTGLNFLGRLSGVATLTAAFVAETAGTGARIAATRKTTPGLRALEKAAVEHGGGLPHRFGLFDSAMIKDNHIAAAGGLTAAVELVRSRLGHAHLIEVETETLAQVEEALACRVHVIMLDNADVELVRAAVRFIAGRAVVETSGRITLERVRELAHAGVDVISAGALVTRARWIDIALDMET